MIQTETPLSQQSSRKISKRKCKFTLLLHPFAQHLPQHWWSRWRRRKRTLSAQARFVVATSTGRPHCTKISSNNIVISSLYGETKHQNNCKTQCEIPLGGYVSWCLKECVSAALTLIATPMLSLLVNRHNLNQPLTCAKVYHLPCPQRIESCTNCIA